MANYIKHINLGGEYQVKDIEAADTAYTADEVATGISFPTVNPVQNTEDDE